MRRIKKVLASFVMVCMLSSCLTMIANAASAQLRFTDPSTTVGAEVEITAKLSSASNLQSLDATLTYDTSMLKFISGDDTSGGDGTLNISGSGSGTSMEFVLKFQALAEGTAKVEIADASGTDANGSALQITEGSSTITIGPGDPSLITDEDDNSTAPVGDGPQVEVDGVQYIVTNDFSDAVIPNGFVKSEMTFEGANCQVVTQAASSASAMYLTPVSGGDADFFLYDSDKGSFAPFEEVEIAADRYLVMLRNDGSVKLPEQYQETTLTLNGKEFTAWQDTTNAEYYVVYALNTDGQKVLYQYDTVDKTYQRFIQQAATTETKDKKSPKGIWGKILQFIEDFLDIAVIIGAIVLLLLIIVLIVVGIKLRHRNLELDDLYDEYGIDLEEEEEPVKDKKAAKAGKVTSGKGKKAAAGKDKSEPAVRVPAKTMSLVDEEDFDDFDDYDDEDFDDYDEDDYEEDYGYDNEDESDEMIDDLDELLSTQPQKKRGHMEPDDTFKVDFIDLD